MQKASTGPDQMDTMLLSLGLHQLVRSRIRRLDARIVMPCLHNHKQDANMYTTFIFVGAAVSTARHAILFVTRRRRVDASFDAFDLLLLLICAFFTAQTRA